MTSLSLFHLGICLRGSDLEERRGANLAGETVAGLVPGVAGAECDVDLPPEPLLCPQRSLVDLVAIRFTDDEQVDVVGDGPTLTLIASCPRSVDHELLDPAERAAAKARRGPVIVVTSDAHNGWGYQARATNRTKQGSS